MKTSITIPEAENILNKHIKTQFILDHSLESAVIMKALAKHFNENEDLWYIIGLLHDLDMDKINGDYSTHGESTIKILKEEGYQIPELFSPILSHTECLNCMKDKYQRKEKVDFALAASEQITGIITAYARMRPNKFEGIEVRSINKKLKDKAFAANVNRDFINDIEKTGIDKNLFIEISINAIYEIKDKINI